MRLLPGPDEVRTLLDETGALRKGHFILPPGGHTDTYLQTALALRYYHNARILSVALSRMLRTEPSVRPQLPRLAVVTSTRSGIPVAFGVREALDAEQIFWVESVAEGLRFREFIEIQGGEKFIVVVDVIRQGHMTQRLKNLLESHGGRVLATGALVDLRVEHGPLGGELVYSLLHLPTDLYDAEDCPLCQRGEAAVRIEFL